LTNDVALNRSETLTKICILKDGLTRARNEIYMLNADNKND